MLEEPWPEGFCVAGNSWNCFQSLQTHLPHKHTPRVAILDGRVWTGNPGSLPRTIECPRTIVPKWGVWVNEQNLVFRVSALASVSASPGGILQQSLHPQRVTSTITLFLFSDTLLSGRSGKTGLRNVSIPRDIPFSVRSELNLSPWGEGFCTAVRWAGGASWVERALY